MVLFLIGGILVIADSVMAYYSVSLLESSLKNPNVTAHMNLNLSAITEIKNLGPVLLSLSIVGAIAGLVLLLVAYMLHKKPQSAKTWAIIGIIFSLVSFAGNGGFIIGMILGIVAGVLALTKQPITQQIKKA
ncbi:MAG: DUF6114 domain-containing protein [Candidatus Micrarchaeia archaeon]